MSDPVAPGDPFPAGSSGDGPRPAPRRGQVRRDLGREAALVPALLAVGLALGGLWAWLAPGVAGRGDPAEARIAVDGTLALIMLGAGVVTAIVLALRPGGQPAVRLVAALLGSLAGGLLAWLVGHLSGLSVGAPAVTLLWALALAVLTALRALAGLVATPA
jgi:hypothetical protein